MTLPEGRVSLGWLHARLDTQATYLLIFVLAMIGALPGASLPAGLAICALSIGMMAPRGAQILPAAIAVREIGAHHARYALGHAITVLKTCRRYIPGRGGDGLARLAPLAGAVLFALGAMMLIPIPLSNVIPAFVAAVLALALVEGSAILFAAAITSAVGAALFMAVTISAASNLI
jgi:hypothetical protein